MNTKRPVCAVCGAPAAKKCTRCGKLFCNVHVRYGNPYFAFHRLVSGSSGYYCDECWNFYARRAKTNLVIVLAIILVVALAVGGGILFLL